jgi:signal transduction histidine kinase/CheY-like chemotaxis protein
MSEASPKEVEHASAARFSRDVRSLLYSNHVDAVLVTDQAGALLMHNAAATRLFGTRRDMLALLGLDASAQGEWRVEDVNGVPIPPERWPLLRARQGSLLAEELFWFQRLKAATVFAASVNTSIYRDFSSDRRLTVISLRDLTRQKLAEKEVERNLRDLTFLMEASRGLIGARDHQTLLRKSTEAIDRLLRPDLAAAQYRITEHGFQFSAYGSEAAQARFEGPERVPLRRVYSGLLFQPSLKLSGQNLRNHPAWWGVEGGQENWRGLLAARLEDDQGKADGWLVAIACEEGPPFSRRDESVLGQLASLTSLALRQLEAQSSLHAQRDKLEALTGDLKNLNQTLEEQVRERTRLAEQRSRQLLALTVQLAEAEERERDRLASLLHDDLQQVLAGASILLQSLPPTLAHYPKEREPCEHLLLRIGELLQESLSKARHLSYELSPPVLHQGGLLPALEWLARSMREQHGLELSIRSERWRDVEVKAWRSLLYRSLQELLFNVVKHAGTRSAAIELVRTDGLAEVTVWDRGRGFDPAILRAAGGAGLGFGLLTIQERIRAMGGSFELESSPGGGTRIKLTFPVPEGQLETVQPAAAEAQAEDAKCSSPPEGVCYRVLFADDHKVIRQGLVALLQGPGDIKVVGQAADGLEAVELARSLRPDVVVMDVSMPVMDGVEATRRIKAEQPAIRVIGLSMLEEGEIAERMQKAGAEAFVNKAESAATLLRAIYRISGSGAAPAGALDHSVTRQTARPPGE